MNKARAAAEKYLHAIIRDIDPTGFNTEKWNTVLGDMTDETFHNYMVGLRDKSMSLVLFVPPFKNKGITTENNLKVAKKYGIPMFDRIKYTNDPEKPDYTSQHESLLLLLPLRRQSQNLVKKISVPDDNKTIDYLTYQPTGDSKGSSLSRPEINVLEGMGLDNSIEEMFRYRGGDKGGFRAYNASIGKLGSVSLSTIAPYTTGVESTKVVKAFLNAMMLHLED